LIGLYDSTGRMIGFKTVHGLYTENNEFVMLYSDKTLYTDRVDSTTSQNEAAKQLLQRLQAQGIPIYGRGSKNMRLSSPYSPVMYYVDAMGDGAMHMGEGDARSYSLDRLEPLLEPIEKMLPGLTPEAKRMLREGEPAIAGAIGGPAREDTLLTRAADAIDTITTAASGLYNTVTNTVASLWAPEIEPEIPQAIEAKKMGKLPILNYIRKKIPTHTIDDLVGSGGTADVFKARNKETGETVAVKVGTFFDPEMNRELIENEVDALSKMDHPNILKYYDSNLEGIFPYIIEEFVPGLSLEDKLKEGPIPTLDAIVYAESLANTMAYVHEQGVVHYDLKPANIMIRPFKIFDFGLAFEDPYRGPFGTGTHASPEQLSEGVRGPKSDVWSAGATLYEMLTGIVPFADQFYINVISDAKQDPANKITEPIVLNPSIPKPLNDLVMKALSFDPDDRPSMSEWAEDLSKIRPPTSRGWTGMTLEEIINYAENTNALTKPWDHPRFASSIADFLMGKTSTTLQKGSLVTRLSQNQNVLDQLDLNWFEQNIWVSETGIRQEIVSKLGNVAVNSVEYNPSEPFADLHLPIPRLPPEEENVKFSGIEYTPNPKLKLIREQSRLPAFATTYWPEFINTLFAGTVKPETQITQERDGPYILEFSTPSETNMDNLVRVVVPNKEYKQHLINALDTAESQGRTTPDIKDKIMTYDERLPILAVDQMLGRGAGLNEQDIVPLLTPDFIGEYYEQRREPESQVLGNMHIVSHAQQADHLLGADIQKIERITVGGKPIVRITLLDGSSHGAEAAHLSVIGGQAIDWVPQNMPLETRLRQLDVAFRGNLDEGKSFSGKLIEINDQPVNGMHRMRIATAGDAGRVFVIHKDGKVTIHGTKPTTPFGLTSSALPGRGPHDLQPVRLDEDVLLEEGDKVLITTDGLMDTAWLDEQGRPHLMTPSPEAFRELLLKYAHQTPEEIRAALLEERRAFTEDKFEVPIDDITFNIIEISEAAERPEIFPGPGMTEEGRRALLEGV
ncbi:MAG: protein kinase, partial [Candidatus Nanoarchaeia archaeon]